MCKYAILLLLVCKCSISFSQANANEYETDFAWHVKQVDEFIERFNNKDETLIKLYAKKYNSSAVLTREVLLKSLFNAESKSWNIGDIKSFINQVNNKKRPVYINFFDNSWCAKLVCSVNWKGKPQTVLLTLKIKKLPDESSKWVITGAEAGFLKQQRLTDSIANRPLTPVPVARDPKTSLHPFSHATRFMNIDLVSKDKINIENYYVKTVSEGTNDLPTFINEVVNNRLVVKRAVSLNYKFYQISGWVFEVNEFDRQSRNSGWLISKLTKVPL